jgi:hypothetical protein
MFEAAGPEWLQNIPKTYRSSVTFLAFIATTDESRQRGLRMTCFSLRGEGQKRCRRLDQQDLVLLPLSRAACPGR